MKSVIITIYGRVQGVGYRYFVLQKASDIGITGFVRNLPGGNVYVEATGQPQDIRLFTDHLRIGPSLSLVNRIDIQECPYQEFTGFSIL